MFEIISLSLAATIVCSAIVYSYKQKKSKNNSASEEDVCNFSLPEEKTKVYTRTVNINRDVDLDAKTKIYHIQSK